MAAKINTRFVLGVVLVVAMVAALLGGIYVLKLRGDATRNIRRGEAAIAKGEYRAALDQFGRALAKDPGNSEYLQRCRETIAKIVPQTPTEAAEFYMQSMGFMNHQALYDSKNAEAHLEYLRTLTASARMINDPRSWESVLAAADFMLQSVDAGDPKRPLGRVYRGMAISRLTATRSDDEIRQALEELAQASVQLSDHDLAWATQIAARAAWVQKLQIAGLSDSSIAAEREEADRIVLESVERVPNGPETARAHLMYLVFKKAADSEAVPNEQVLQAADHLATLIDKDSDPAVINDSVAMFTMLPGENRQRAEQLLRDVVEAHPDAHLHRMMLARLLFDQGDLDEAESAARVIIDAEPLPVGLMARMIHGLKLQAAAMVGDIEFVRFERVSPDDRSGQMDKMQAARDVLANLSTNAATDPMVTRAEAKIAFAKGQYVEASQKFERLVRETNERDAEILAFASVSLEQIGQPGLAHERITKAVQLTPNATRWIAQKANLEMRMGQVDQAAGTINMLSEDARRDPLVMQVVTAVQRAAAGGAATPSDDPVQGALDVAQEALQNNEHENARAALLSALQDHAESIPLLQALAVVELRAGDREASRRYVDRALAVAPTNPALNQLSAALQFEDPVEATLAYVQAMTSDDKTRLTATISAMSGLITQQMELQEQLSAQRDAAGAEKASHRVERARAEAGKAAEELRAVDPENPQLVEYLFSRALLAKDWNAAAQHVQTARRLNLDAAEGLLFDGRLKLAQGNTREAIPILEATTDRIGFSSFAWRMLAIAYQSAGNFAQAERAYEQAYRCNPNDVAGARVYLGLLRQRGDLLRALEILQSIHRLAPNDKSLREGWLDMEAAVGDKALALRERTKFYDANKADADNSIALARLLATTEPAPDLMLNDDGERMYSPQRWAAMPIDEQERTRQSYRERWSAKADQIIAELIAGGSNDLRVAVLRATVLRARGEVLAGETVLRDFIASQPAEAVNEDMYIELGRFQAAVNRYNDAIESLKKAVALGKDRQRDAELNLGSLYMQLGRYTEALEVFESAQARMDDQRVRLQIIECLINVDRLDEAERLLAESAADDSGSVITLLSARIAEQRGKALLARGDSAGADRAFAQQRELLGKAEQLDPGNPMPRILLAQSLVDEFNRTQRPALLDDALVALERADRIRTGLPQVNMLRVSIQRARGDTTAAIADLQQQLKDNPSDINARKQLIQMYAEARNFNAALSEIDAAISVNPTLADWHEAKGDVQARDMSNLQEAIVSYESAYRLAPSSPMLLKLVSAMLSRRPADCATAIQRLESRPDAMDIEPSLRDAYARALVCANRRDEGIEQLRVAHAAHRKRIADGLATPSSMATWFTALGSAFSAEQASEAEGLLMELTGDKPSMHELNAMARMWASLGANGFSRAIELQRAAIEACPPSETQALAMLHSDLGDLLFTSGDTAAAAEAYEQAINRLPTAWNAVNNLAYLKAELLNDPMGAVSLAQRLIEGGQRQPNVLDTVGWVYYKSGDLQQAVRYLEESIALGPAPDTYVHLAQVKFALGDRPGAEKSLQDAEKLKPSSETMQKIRSVRDDIEKAG